MDRSLVSVNRDPSAAAEPRPSAVEGVISRSLEDEERVGRPLTGHALRYRRSVEAYLKAGAPPRWMERINEIDRAVKRERRRLGLAHAQLASECGDDPAAFAQRWRAAAAAWSFDRVNELIGQHNAWYPIERDLPMDPRTGDYVSIHGRSYRREPLDAAWVVAEFPPHPPHPPYPPAAAAAAASD